MMKITVVGVGNMGGAIIKGLTNSGIDDLRGMNPTNSRVSKLAEQLNFTLFHTAAEVINDQPDVVILTTPANVTVAVAKQLNGLAPQTVIISAAAGITQRQLKAVLPNNQIATIIPNTPVAVNAGTIGLALPHDGAESAQPVINHVLNQLGDIITVAEDKLDIVGVIGGCGPAFVDVFMDALSDAAVKYGLDRQTAYELIASMVKGSGTLAHDTGKAPAELRDQVTSPAGTTIKGVEALEKHGFRYAIIDAVNRANGGELLGHK
ncbi:pyrroline-5-carboxylate reductase [Limosilactobacillus sp.]|uniref:pyrroline-5-carboxylate reductase n=1 Tax=Limosilactobacillus sp. TaxID=2773925 RepID=UPI0035A04584